MIIVYLLFFYLEYEKYKTENWYNHKFVPPKWLRHIVNKTGFTFENTPMKELDVNITRRCYKKQFEEVLLIIGFGALTEYESIPLFELLYKKTFKNRLYCGISSLPNQTEINFLVTDTRYGAFLYDCLDKAMKTHTSYKGYFFIGEEVLLNYWNMKDFDMNKIWEDNNIKHGPTLYEQNKEYWEWWESPWGVRAMEKVYEYFIELNYYDNRKAKLTQGEWAPDWDAGQSLNKWIWNGEGEFKCYWTNRTVLYIPKKYSQLYLNISKHFRASGVRHGITIPSVTRLITLASSNVKLRSAEINENNRNQFLTNRDYLNIASEENDIIYIKGTRKERRTVLNDLRMKEYAVGKFLEYRHC